MTYLALHTFGRAFDQTNSSSAMETFAKKKQKIYIIQNQGAIKFMAYDRAVGGN